MALLAARLRGLGTGVAMLASACALAHAQMPLGSVSTLDATVTGANSVANERAEIGKNGTVVAKDHVAYVQLYRGGSVKVCATSGVHLTAGTPSVDPAEPPAGASTPATSDAAAAPSAATKATWAANIPPPIMVALDRGAMELRTGAIPGDIVMTPDLRFTFAGDGQLDVHIRVTRNGDTCVENRIAGLTGHPELRVGSLFGDETYNILPGQHVLFSGGNLREVVDNESSPCGCPDATVKPPPAPEVGSISLKKVPKTATPPAAAAQNPFPADVSQGLAPPPPVPQAPPGVVHTQVATSLVYNPSPADAAAPNQAVVKPAAPPAEKTGFFHAIGRFFRHIF